MRLTRLRTHNRAERVTPCRLKAMTSVSSPVQTLPAFEAYTQATRRQPKQRGFLNSRRCSTVDQVDAGQFRQHDGRRVIVLGFGKTALSAFSRVKAPVLDAVGPKYPDY